MVTPASQAPRAIASFPDSRVRVAVSCDMIRMLYSRPGPVSTLGRGIHEGYAHDHSMYSRDIVESELRCEKNGNSILSLYSATDFSSSFRALKQSSA